MLARRVATITLDENGADTGGEPQPQQSSMRARHTVTDQLRHRRASRRRLLDAVARVAWHAHTTYMIEAPWLVNGGHGASLRPTGCRGPRGLARRLPPPGFVSRQKQEQAWRISKTRQRISVRPGHTVCHASARQVRFLDRKIDIFGFFRLCA